LKLVTETMVVDGRAHPPRGPWRPFLAAGSALAVVGLLGLAATAYVALRTSPGLSLDSRLLNAVSSTSLAQYPLHSDLRGAARWSILVLALACVLLALLRPRLALWMGAVIVIGGANVAAQVLQQDVFTRSVVDPGANGLPSRHMTIALSVGLAAVLVAPAAWRSIVAVGVSAAATVVGVALVLGRWHRPSDVIAAVFLCMVWAAVGLLIAGVIRRRPAAPSRSAVAPSPSTVAPSPSTLAVVAALIGAWTVGLLLVWWGARPPAGLPDLGLAIISLGSIGLACTVCVVVVARVADRHLG